MRTFSLKRILSLPVLLCWPAVTGLSGNGPPLQPSPSRLRPLRGWFSDFEKFFDPHGASSSSSSSTSSSSRQLNPEQYPATLTSFAAAVDSDGPEAVFVRPLLHSTQLQTRPLVVAYRASEHGWTAEALHRQCDGRGASVVFARTSSGLVVGGYNPKGWAGLGGARPSVAAFLFVGDDSPAGGRGVTKLRKVGGGGLAIATDAPEMGISFGPDALVVPLAEGGSQRVARSKLGPYFERGPNGERTLFEFGGDGGDGGTAGRGGGAAELVELTVLVGEYGEGEEVPYSGGVLDMTSG